MNQGIHRLSVNCDILYMKAFPINGRLKELHKFAFVARLQISFPTQGQYIKYTYFMPATHLTADFHLGTSQRSRNGMN